MKLNDYKLWTALVTPLTPGLKVDYPSLRKLIKEQTNAGNALLALGSTGEALNLDLDTQKEIVEFFIAENPSTPLMIGVGGHNLAAQQQWINWLETKNEIDAYLMVTPIYAKPGSFGQYEWFKTLMDEVTKPVMLYNVPGRAAMDLCFDAVKKLSTHKNFWSIKEASGSTTKMLKYLAAADSGNPQTGKVYCGDDGLLPSFCNAGACGLVSVAANTWPAETNLYVEQSLNKTISEAQMWNQAANSLFVASNPVPAKALLAMEGRISHGAMMPPLSQRDLTDTGILALSSEKIRAWYKKNL